MKIYAPVKDANGVWASVRFVNGVGETDNPRLIEWFRSRGYIVEDNAYTAPTWEAGGNESVEETDESDLEAMTPNELREYAKANGLGGIIKNTRNKEKLLELIRG